MERDLKIVIVGDGGIGKTCLTITYERKAFPHNEFLPHVCDPCLINVDVDGQSVAVELWDSAGQEDFDRIRPLAYPDTDVFFLCFSVSSQVSFEHIRKKWYPEIHNHSPKTPIFLVGLKSDHRNDEAKVRELADQGLEMVDRMEALNLASEINAVEFHECSASRLDGLSNIIERAVRVGLNKAEKGNSGDCQIQ